MPKGTFRIAAYSICRLTTPRYVRSQTELRYVLIRSAGIKYSNIVPDHESSVASLPDFVIARPSLNQCAAGA
ncbi:hypothetical protein D3C84_951880 [compost metagenome]